MTYLRTAGLMVVDHGLGLEKPKHMKYVLFGEDWATHGVCSAFTKSKVKYRNTDEQRQML